MRSIKAGFSHYRHLANSYRKLAQPNPMCLDANALASSIVLVCRQTSRRARALATRREFVSALKSELPIALHPSATRQYSPCRSRSGGYRSRNGHLHALCQGPLTTTAQPLPVRDALALINQTLDEALAEQEGDFDTDTRWAVGLVRAVRLRRGRLRPCRDALQGEKTPAWPAWPKPGIVVSRGGKVRLLKPGELPDDWNPATDPRADGLGIRPPPGPHPSNPAAESAAAELTAILGSTAETARELCYRLYTLCERKKRAAEALSYNALVRSWPEITRLAQERKSAAQQAALFPAGLIPGASREPHGTSRVDSPWGKLRRRVQAR